MDARTSETRALNQGRMPRAERLALIEERVLRMRHGATLPRSARLDRKTSDPEVLARLEAIERELVARLWRR